jgi:cytochrome c peroxidase
VLNRGAMTLTNAAYNPAFTWANDRTVTLEAQMEQPLFNQHPVEMGLVRDDPGLMSWLREQRGYAAAFESAFPRNAAPVSMDDAIKAIAAFERTLISGRSAFDRYVYDDDRNALSEDAKRGMALFYSERAGCAKCHSGINFSGSIVHRGAPKSATLFANNGSFAADDGIVTDRGLIDVTHQQRDLGRFRVPTLRNVELTAPYMHDGHLATLEAVVEHYALGGQREGHANKLVDPAIRRLDLSPDEKRQLVAFLRSLTDQAFVSRDYSACRTPTASPGAAH